MKDKSVQITSPPMNIELSKHSDKDIKLYTNFSSYALFNIYNYVSSTCNDDKCPVELHQLDPKKVFPGFDSENQFFLVMYKLWQNPTDKKVAEDFGISSASVSRMFNFLE